MGSLQGEGVKHSTMAGCRQQNLDCRKIPASPDCEEMIRFLLGKKKKVVHNAREVQRENFVHQRDRRHVKQWQSIDFILIQIKINELNNSKNTYEAMGKSER